MWEAWTKESLLTNRNSERSVRNTRTSLPVCCYTNVSASGLTLLHNEDVYWRHVMMSFHWTTDFCSYSKNRWGQFCLSKVNECFHVLSRVGFLLGPNRLPYSRSGQIWLAVSTHSHTECERWSETKTFSNQKSMKRLHFCFCCRDDSKVSVHSSTFELWMFVESRDRKSTRGSGPTSSD